MTHHPHSGTYLPTGSLLDENPGSTLSGNQHTTVSANGTYTFRGYWRGAGDANGRTIQLLGRDTNAFTIGSISVKELPGNHASQNSATLRPLMQSSEAKNFIDYDQVDDKLTITSATAIGASCTVVYASSAGIHILTGQNVGTSYDLPNVDVFGLVIINRALTGDETTALANWLLAQTTIVPVVLTPANSIISHIATSPSLSAHATLHPANALHDWSGSAPVLSSHADLLIQSASHGHYATSPDASYKEPVIVVEVLPAGTVRARQGDTIDLLIWREAGLGPTDLPAVFAANPGLVDQGPILPIGTKVKIPARAPATKTNTLIQLWD